MRSMVNPKHKTLSIEDQCRLLGKSRAWYYYKPYKSPSRTRRDNLEKKKIKDLWEEHIFLGYIQISDLLNEKNTKTSPKRVYRLMRELGIKAVVPKRGLTKPNKKHKKNPYLLRGLKVIHKNQVWSTDITYVGLPGGTAYIIAIIDLHSRKILSRNVSNTMDTAFVMEALLRAMMKHGVPEIINTDQGSQFTSQDFTSFLEHVMVKISMDGKGRALDNIFIERFWKTLKYEDIFIYGYETLKDLRKGVKKYIKFYNSERPHQSLGGKSPDKIYHSDQSLIAA